jgi:hypothetical protein
MTTVALIAGMLPIELGLGADARFRQPVAVAVSDGLLTSTALSLLVVSVVFSLLKTSSKQTTFRIPAGFERFGYGELTSTFAAHINLTLSLSKDLTWLRQS